MSSITPIKIEYNFRINNHVLKASAEHLEEARKITFYFDERIVSERELPPGDFLTDDDCISELVENYCKNNTGVLADLFKNHSDKVHLTSKTMDFRIEYYGTEINANVIVQKDNYYIRVVGNNGADAFNGNFKSSSFSEVLEKVRIFTSTLEGISEGFSSHINELSNDKVEAWIKWD